jgi:spore germination cell wall hydrolase CwlJ-like protein
MVRLAADEFRERDPGVELDRKQLACLQRALYFEARGEGSLGQAAVAHVALNRVGTRPSRATICEVVREPGQFAPYLNGEPDEADLAQTDEDATRSAIETAAMVMAGYVPDPSRGGQYFYAPRILKTQPAWAKGLKETARIGGHRFFADPEALAPAPTRLARN